MNLLISKLPKLFQNPIFVTKPKKQTSQSYSAKKKSCGRKNRVWLMTLRELITVSLNDLKAAPSAITPDCLIDTFVDDAAKSVEPDPPHMPHILEKQDEEWNSCH